MRDARLAVRALLRARVFTLAITGTIGLGLTVTLTLFAVVNAYLLRSMPYPAADRLYHVVYAPPGTPEPEGMSSIAWQELSDIVEHADASAPTRLLIDRGTGLEEVMGLSLAKGSAGILGLQVALGRPIEDGDFVPGAESVALLGHGFWRDRFASDPAAIGRLLRVRRASSGAAETLRIVGVLPADFRYARDHARGPMDVVVPLREPLRSYLVRVREGVPVRVAESRITAAARAVARVLPPSWSGVRLESVHARYVRDIRPVLRALTAAGALVLLIVAANAIVLMLLRTLRRRHELAIRAVLGASRRDLGRTLGIEALLICAAALGTALAVTRIANSALAPVIQERLGREPPGGTGALTPDAAVVLVVTGATLLIALALASVPVFLSRHRGMVQPLESGARTATSGRTFRRTASTLIGAEIALALPLLVASGLMTRTVVHLVTTDLGIRTAGIARVRIALPASTHPDAPSLLDFYDRLYTALPGNAHVLTDFIPFYETPPQPLEHEADGAASARSDATFLAVGGNYFGLLDIRLVRGRTFGADDRVGTEAVAIVSETFARRAWPNGDAIGRRLRAVREDSADEWRAVVGIVGDVRQTHTDTDLRDVYVPFSQLPSRYASLYFREARPPFASYEDLRASVARIDPSVLVSDAVTGMRSLAAEEQRQLAGPKFLLAVLTAFAAIAVLLAALGVYGVTAYAVQQRNREVAIRIALGASPRAIGALFIGEAARVFAVAAACGLLASFLVGRLLAHQFHGVTSADPVTLACACAFMLAAGMLATLLPVRRAAAGDVHALHGD